MESWVQAVSECCRFDGQVRLRKEGRSSCGGELTGDIGAERYGEAVTAHWGWEDIGWLVTDGCGTF